MNTNLRLEVATRMAPAFRDKLDFSDDKDYEKLADYAFKAADAILKKHEELVKADEAKAKEAKK